MYCCDCGDRVVDLADGHSGQHPLAGCRRERFNLGIPQATQCVNFPPAPGLPVHGRDPTSVAPARGVRAFSGIGLSRAFEEAYCLRAVESEVADARHFPTAREMAAHVNKGVGTVRARRDLPLPVHSVCGRRDVRCGLLGSQRCSCRHIPRIRSSPRRPFNWHVGGRESLYQPEAPPERDHCLQEDEPAYGDTRGGVSQDTREVRIERRLRGIVERKVVAWLLRPLRGARPTL
mmetsp:Transcript_66938/g.193834  ORF Transcript_66938/g.193834 Transcript_66938/m.193834 type:complete len:233 (-) Transcript_66938:1044-1742(-)